MSRIAAVLVLATALVAGGPALAQRPPADDSIAQIPQSAPGTPWSFIGFGVTTPANTDWKVASSTPRGATMARAMLADASQGAVLVIASELRDAEIASDADLLAVVQAQHARIGERYAVAQHEETLVRHAGTRCARHTIAARVPEDKSPRKDAAKKNDVRPFMHIVGLSCVHPTEPRLLIEVGVSERGTRDAIASTVLRDAEAVMASLAFQRYSEAALQKAAELARAGNVRDAEAQLKPYIDADAAWARFFLAQIMQRTVPPPDNLDARMKALLEPAAERGLADAQWMLGTLYLRGGTGVPRDTAMGGALLRRAAERGNAGAAFQLGLALLSDKDGLAPDQREAVLWISRSAARGQKEAQELLKSARDGKPPSAAAPAAPANPATPKPSNAPAAPASR